MLQNPYLDYDGETKGAVGASSEDKTIAIDVRGDGYGGTASFDAA